MNKINFLPVLIIFIFFQSCSLFEKDDCEDYACFTPPETFYFELVNQQRNNALADSTFDQNKLKVIRLEDNVNLNYDTLSVEGSEILSVEQIGWEQGLKSYKFVYNDAELFTMKVDAERVTENCCTYTRYHEKTLLNAEFTKETDKQLVNHYRVIVSY